MFSVLVNGDVEFETYDLDLALQMVANAEEDGASAYIVEEEDIWQRVS